MREATRGRDCVFFTCLDHWLIQDDFRPLLGMSKDGRHLDHFPKGSAVIQGAIFSGFMAEIRSVYDLLDRRRISLAESKDLGTLKPYMYVERGQRAGMCIIKTGQDVSKLNTKLDSRPGDEYNIIVDMLDHLIVSKISLLIQPESTKQEITGEIQLATIQHKHQHVVLRRAFSTQGDGQISMELEPTVARAIWVRIQFAEAEIWNTDHRVRVRDIQLKGPNYIISNS